MTWFCAKQFFDGTNLKTNYRFQVKDGVVTSTESDQGSNGGGLNDQGSNDFLCPDVQFNGLVTPGFLDAQVNGGGGVLLNQAPSVVTLKTMFSAHQQFGTTSMLPTLITDNLSVMQNAADAIAQAKSENIEGVVGVHFEGPHLSVAKRGIHPSDQVRAITDAELKVITRNDLGKVLLTVAPENVSPDVIKDLVSQGVIVALGHSNADFNTVLAAIDAGATGVTHLFNAMSGLQARAPGLIGAALDDERITAGLIVDLLHVHETNCRLAFKAKSAKGVMLVTDAMAHVGSDLMSLPWLDSTITRVGDKLTTPDGTLAGSCLDMMAAVRNSQQVLGIPLEDVLHSATQVPAKFLGLNDIGHLNVGAKADFLVINDNMQIEQVYQSGRLI
ncbi:N-acetylglucosamine-6-phosphate deacetylase [uncultured Psychrosphaera sp.]|uniref:N-acetylglucosamine-6-phosphate deacetylase n=1 Tax=uncultured Psychrosphaera sp. TaxID=1403522 RepID=UPI00261C1C45|nr:N-acetylglucosamine-6-phosphate deacetylase [uncultured Psychrosphaera sp.]